MNYSSENALDPKIVKAAITLDSFNFDFKQINIFSEVVWALSSSLLGPVAIMSM